MKILSFYSVLFLSCFAVACVAQGSNDTDREVVVFEYNPNYGFLDKGDLSNYPHVEFAIVRVDQPEGDQYTLLDTIHAYLSPRMCDSALVWWMASSPPNILLLTMQLTPPYRKDTVTIVPMPLNGSGSSDLAYGKYLCRDSIYAYSGIGHEASTVVLKILPNGLCDTLQIIERAWRPWISDDNQEVFFFRLDKGLDTDSSLYQVGAYNIGSDSTYILVRSDGHVSHAARSNFSAPVYFTKLGGESDNINLYRLDSAGSEFQLTNYPKGTGIVAFKLIGDSIIIRTLNEQEVPSIERLSLDSLNKAVKK